MPKRLAIIGASYLQNPLILKAKSMGIETHVFAWEAGDIGERTADHFYPISITEKEEILEKCREIGVDGITTIASDLATVAVGYVASAMGLVGNSPDCIIKSTNKEAMRKAFEQHGDPSPKSIPVDGSVDLSSLQLIYPVIVKPADRSGSRGITKLYAREGLEEAVDAALDQSFSKEALVEEFAEGTEYSVESISWRGRHRMITITEKFTSGAPHFIERGHLEPARLSDEQYDQVEAVVLHALDSLGVEYGASHSELKIDSRGQVKIIEIGARMGGDFIGSRLVEESTGYDFLKAVIDVALGREPAAFDGKRAKRYAGVRFVFDGGDIAAYQKLVAEKRAQVVLSEVPQRVTRKAVDSSTRSGYYLFTGERPEDVLRYLPSHDEEVG